MTEHAFTGENGRCVNCGTLKEYHERLPSPCPYGAPIGTALRPEPSLRQLAADDADTIHARLAELRTIREAGWNTQEEIVTG